MKKEGIFYTLRVFLQKTKKSFNILTVYKHSGLPLAILSPLRQPHFLEPLHFINFSKQLLFYILVDV